MAETTSKPKLHTTGCSASVWHFWKLARDWRK